MVDGKSLLRSLRESLQENSISAFINDRTSYDYLYQAAIEWALRTRTLTSTQSITTVADQAAYALNADFLGLDMRDNNGDYFVKLNDGTNDYFIPMRNYEKVIYENQTDSVAIPSYFSITDYPSLYTQEAGTATSAGTSAAGLSTLTDTAADFTYVSAGDIVHNTTQSTSGVVVSKTSTTVLSTALFTEDGTFNQAWTQNDAYVIQPQSRMQIVLDPPPSTASYTITVYYIQRPAPVYHHYGVYRIQAHYLNALVSYATFLYKYRDREPNYGDLIFRFFEREVQRAVGQYGFKTRKFDWKVSFMRNGR